MPSRGGWWAGRSLSRSPAGGWWREAAELRDFGFLGGHRPAGLRGDGGGGGRSRGGSGSSGGVGIAPPAGRGGMAGGRWLAAAVGGRILYYVLMRSPNPH